MRALVLATVGTALAGCSQIIGIEDFENAPPAVLGTIYLKPDFNADLVPLPDATVEWFDDEGDVQTGGTTDPDGFYALDLAPTTIAKQGFLHIASQYRDTYYHPIAPIDFATQFYVVVYAEPALDMLATVNSQTAGPTVMVGLVRDAADGPVFGATARLFDDATEVGTAAYGDDNGLPTPTNTFTGGSGAAWFFDVPADRDYHVEAARTTERFRSRVVRPTGMSLHYIEAAPE